MSIIQQHHENVPKLEHPQSESVQSTPPNLRGRPTKPPPPRNVPLSEKRHLLLSILGKQSAPFPLLGPGPSMITDPGGGPALPDQPPFSTRRWSVVTRSGIIANPAHVFSAPHPGYKNGIIASFKFGQRVAVCPDFPQEKHITSVQSRRFGRCHGGGRCRWRCPSRKVRGICSSVVGAGGPIHAGGRPCVSRTSFCSSFSTSAPPASEPDAPRSQSPAGASPLTDSVLISVR